MNNQAFTVQQTQVDYFYDNFTREGLNYVKYDLKARIERYKSDLKNLQKQRDLLAFSEGSIESMLSTATEELQHVISAIKEKNQANA
jgi:replication fork clamp-binding protein CrfC